MAEEQTNEVSVFDSLAQKLSEHERKEFLKKIRSNLNFESPKEGRVHRQQTDDEERSVRIQRDLRKLSPFRSLYFLIVGGLTGKTREQLLYRQKMKELKRSINRKASGIVGFETRTLKTKLPEKVFSLYLSTLPLYEFFNSVWQDSNNSIKLQEFFFRLVDSRMDEETGGIFSFYPFEEMVQDYRKRGSKEDLYKEIDKKVDRFVQSIPRNTFKVVEDVLRPLYFMKDLVLFPYRMFFSSFHGTLRTDEPTKAPLFKSTSAVVTLEELEDLYYALYNASKADVVQQLSMDWVSEIFTEVLNRNDEEEKEDNETSSADRLIEDMKNLSAEVKKTMKELPLPEIIRFFREDPYYKLVIYMPKFDVVSFYRHIKKMSLQLELDDKINRVREQALNEEREALFSGHILKELQHYRIYSSIDYEQMGIPAFSYHKALFVLYNYLLIFYSNDIQRLIQVCQQVIPQQDRITKDRIVQHAANVEDVVDQIIALDDSLSEEQEEGKMFNRLRFQNSIDSEQKRLYRSLVVKKDREAKEMLERGSEAITGLKKIFLELKSTRERQVKESMEKKYLFHGRPMLLKDKLDESVEQISILQRMLDQYTRIRAEKGTDESLG